MKKVFIKYNPYSLKTELTVDGKTPPENSQISESSLTGSRLQEWVENLPKILIDEYNDTEFDIVFHGTSLDCEDLTEVFNQAFERGDLTSKPKLDWTPAKETSDKEVLIDEVFKEIQAGPFDELRDEEIISAFKHAKSSDFEICVVATMSAGKSTLINSMLGTKLMPSKQEACTAIITRIKDAEGKDTWQAKVYDKNNNLIEEHENLTYAIMERLNGDENISVIKDVSLVLIDTPDLNNSRDPEHRKVQSEFLNKSSKSLVLYIMEGTFGSDDDNALLQRVADSMKVGGKQSKDRFIFVVNKMDDRRKEDGDTTQTLDKIRAYLKHHGITNPNLFPAAALPALNIRLMQSGAEIDEDTMDETEMKVRKLNRNELLHFENYAFLPAGIRKNIDKKLANAKNNGDANAEALIHTGVVSIEASIRQYVQKYAKTAKIKNIVDTFMHKLDEVDCFEKTKQELAKNREDSERIARQIKTIRKNVDDVKSAQQFKDAVDDAVIKVSDEAKDVIDNIVQKYQAKIREKIDELGGRKLVTDEVKDEIKDEVSSLERCAKKLESDFQAELDELIHENLVKTSNALLQEYKKKLASLESEIDPNAFISEINPNALAGISIEPFKLMGGTVPTADDFSVTKLVKSKEVEDEKVWVKSLFKKKYKDFLWFKEDGYYAIKYKTVRYKAEKELYGSGYTVTKYKTVKYVPASDLAQEFFAPIKESVVNNGELAQKYAIEQSNRIASSFNKEFERLDRVLKQKLAELESYTTDKIQAEKRIKETESQLAWLTIIKSHVASILEI